MEDPDSPLWEAIAIVIPELQDNPEGATLLVYRLEGQYLPALLKAGTEEARERVWLALWSYITAPITVRKPFSLSSGTADRLIAEVQKLMVSRRNPSEVRHREERGEFLSHPITPPNASACDIR